MTDFLVRGAAELWTGRRDAMRVRGPVDLRVRAGRIAAIGTLAAEPGERVLDAAGCIVYPAWVNTHHHLFQSLLKGIPEAIDLPLVPWLGAVTVPYRAGFRDEDAFRVAVRIGLVELALSGCGTVADHQYHVYPGMDYDPTAVCFEEAARLGLRFVLCRGGQTLPSADAPPEAVPETLEQFLAGVEHDAARFHDPSPHAMRRVVSAITTPHTSCTSDELREIARHARGLGLRLHSHLSETDDYLRWARQHHGCSPIEFAERHEWLGPDVWYAHMVHLDDDELRRCAETGTGIAHCPQSNARLGSGIARIPEALAAGVPVGLAVDGAASNEACDMLSEAHACWLTHRADPRSGRFAGQPGGHAGAMTVEDVVHVGTAGGARVLGLDGVGTLAVGQGADFAVYDLSEPRHFGLHDPAVAPVASGGRTPLKALVVAGRVVVEDDAIPGLDLAGLREDAARWVGALRR